MKQFFRTIKQTFTSKEFYRTKAHQSGWKGIKFLLKLALFLGLALGIIAMIVLLIMLPRFKSHAADIASTTYPDGLVITIQDGTLTTNTLDPVVIPVPAGWEDKDHHTDHPTNLLVVAPGETADPAVLARHDAIAVATSTAIVAGTDTDIRLYSYGKQNYVITKSSFLAMAHSALRTGGTIIAVLAIPLLVMLVPGHVVSKLFFLILVSIVLWFVFKIRKQERSFKQIYRMGLYALVPVVVLDIIAVPLGLAGRALTAAIVLVIILLVTKDTPSTAEVQA
jgi:hypothetical protein